MATRIRNRHVRIGLNRGITTMAPMRYPVIPLSKQDIYVTTIVGDRLDLIANQFYSDVRLSWVIVAANPDIIRRDSISLKPGLEIRIPANPNFAVKLFKMINK